MTTFDARENSNYTGEPVALYEFRRGTAIRCYSSGDQDITAGGNTFVATPLSDAGLNQKGTAVTDVFEVTAPIDLDVVQWFITTAPTDTVYLVVRRFHFGDSESVIMWLGQIVSVETKSDDTAVIRCQQVSVSLKRGGLRLSWQRGCPHALYDQNCTVDKDAYKKTVTITGISGDRVSISPNLLGDAYWNGGIIEFDDGVSTEKRIIATADPVTGTVRVFASTDGLVEGLSVNLYPGCKHTLQWCDQFFNNLANYGGFPWMPNRSPYDGDAVF